MLPSLLTTNNTFPTCNINSGEFTLSKTPRRFCCKFSEDSQCHDHTLIKADLATSSPIATDIKWSTNSPSSQSQSIASLVLVCLLLLRGFTEFSDGDLPTLRHDLRPRCLLLRSFSLDAGKRLLSVLIRRRSHIVRSINSLDSNSR